MNAKTNLRVAVASLTINYIIAQPQGISHATAANMYASCQASFTAGRFLTVPLLRIFDPSLILGVYGTMTVLFSLLTGGLGGVGGIVCLYFLFFFEGIQYRKYFHTRIRLQNSRQVATIYSLGTANLGNYAKFGGALIASCVSGGAWYRELYGKAEITDKFILNCVKSGRCGYIFGEERCSACYDTVLHDHLYRILCRGFLWLRTIYSSRQDYRRLDSV